MLRTTVKLSSGSSTVAMSTPPAVWNTPPAEIPTQTAPTLMDSGAARARLARIVLDYSTELTASREQ